MVVANVDLFNCSLLTYTYNYYYNPSLQTEERMNALAYSVCFEITLPTRHTRVHGAIKNIWD